jgi:predicted MFS family arabinose efflux permease
LPTNFLVLILLAVGLFIFFWWSLPETNLYPNRQALNSKIIFRNHYSTLKDPYFVPYLIVTDLFIVEVYSSVTGFGKPSDYPIAEVFQPRI